jgi:hypothetical protein
MTEERLGRPGPLFAQFLVTINLALVFVRQGRREEAVGILEAFLSQGGQPRAQVEAMLRDLKGETSSGK